jgi:hypothetical protein
LLATLKQQVQIKKWWILLVVLLGWKSKMLQLHAEQLVSTFTDFACVCVCVCVCVYLGLGRWNFELAPLAACIRQKGSLKSEPNLSLKSQDDTQHENPDLCTSLF